MVVLLKAKLTKTSKIQWDFFFLGIIKHACL